MFTPALTFGTTVTCLKGESVKVQEIFDVDEMELHKPQPGDTPEKIFKKGGIYFLKDVAPLYGMTSSSIVNKILTAFKKDKTDMWNEAGLRKTFQHWQVRITVFHTYFQSYLALPYQTIPPKIKDGNQLLALEGTFRLVDVCEYIPFDPAQLRSRANSCDGDSKVAMGIYQLNGNWVVDMEPFKEYITALWNQK